VRCAGKRALLIRLASKPDIQLGCRYQRAACLAELFAHGSTESRPTTSQSRQFSVGRRSAEPCLAPKTEQNLLKFYNGCCFCMTPPSESSSGHIDMFRVRQKPPELPDRSFPAVYVVPRYSVPRYHSMQLALVIGLFACGGLVCSTFFVVENDDFLGPRYWPRKSYSSPALATPQRPVSAPTVPQNGQFKSNDEEKTAALQEHRVGDRKTSTSPLSLASAAQNSVLRR
jgi:hypothetical protein